MYHIINIYIDVHILHIYAISYIIFHTYDIIRPTPPAAGYVRVQCSVPGGLGGSTAVASDEMSTIIVM